MLGQRGLIIACLLNLFIKFWGMRYNSKLAPRWVRLVMYFLKWSEDSSSAVANNCVMGWMQIVIDSCCTTFAEVQKRRKDFWAEFELYAADLLVSVAVDIALVGLLAPYVRIEKPSSTGLFGRFSRMAGSLPSRWNFISSSCLWRFVPHHEK